MKRFILLLVSVLMIWTVFQIIRFKSQCYAVKETILRLSDGAELGFSQILEDLKGVPLIFVGELHDNKAHHEVQLKVVQALHESGIPLAVGLEMFRRKNQSVLDQWIDGGMSEGEFQVHFHENWFFAWPLYRDIFRYAREHKIPLIGLNVPREITRQVTRKGFSSLSREQLGQLPSVSCKVDAEYMDFIRRSFGAHAHGDLNFTYFCEAQMVWDTAMAHHLVNFLKENSRYTVIVLAGNGHAWKRGIPEQVRRQGNLGYRVILPEAPGMQEKNGTSQADADYLWLID